MRNLATRHPLLFAVLAILVYDLAMNALSAGQRMTGLSDLGISLIAQAVFCVYVAALLTALGWWRSAGFMQRVTWRAILVIAITGAYALYGWWLLRRHRWAWVERHASQAAS